MGINEEDIKVGLVYRRSSETAVRTITRIEPDDRYKTKIYYKTKYYKDEENSWNTIAELTSNNNGSIYFEVVGQAPQGDNYEIF